MFVGADYPLVIVVRSYGERAAARLNAGKILISKTIQKLDNDEMFAVGLAANALDCPELLDLISCKVATLTMGKTVAE